MTAAGDASAAGDAAAAADQGVEMVMNLEDDVAVKSKFTRRLFEIQKELNRYRCHKVLLYGQKQYGIHVRLLYS